MADTLARWLRLRVGAGSEGRRNFRLVCAPASLRPQLQQHLDAEPGGKIRWYVRESSAPDAVKLRHGRPADVPSDACIGYVLLWEEGSAAADRNAQSLRDIAQYDVADLLVDPQFELPLEAAIRTRCMQAADAWDLQTRTRLKEHLGAAWDGLRTALRLGPRRRDRALRLVDNLERWGNFLHRCQVPDAEWAGCPPEQRAGLLLSRLGNSLPELGLFTLPALASVLGVTTDPKERPLSPARTGERRWGEHLEEMLLENFQWAADAGALSDTLAGKRTLREQLEALVLKGGVRLSSTGGQEAAAEALESFCREHTPGALEQVEWMFYEDPRNRRSRSMGLAGLLIARGRREARDNPVEKLAMDTVRELGAVVAGGDAACEPLVRDAQASAAGRQILVSALNELGSSTGQALPENWKRLLEGVQLPDVVPERLRTLSERWMAIDRKESPDETIAPTLLLGLARLLAEHTSEETAADEAASATRLGLALREDPAIQAQFTVDSSLPQALRAWLRDKVREACEDPDVTEDELALREQDSLSFEVSRLVGNKMQRLGTVLVQWTAADREVRRGTVETVLRSRELQLDDGFRAPSGMALLRLSSRLTSKAGPSSDALNTAWGEYVRDLGVNPAEPSRFPEVLDLIAPTGDAAKRLVEAWQGQVEQAASRSAEQLLEEKARLQEAMMAAVVAGDLVLAQSLGQQLKVLPPPTASTPNMGIDEARRLLETETWRLVRGAIMERLVLSPHHPLVLRLRVLSDVLLTQVIEALWRRTWPSSAHEDLKDALAGWELPEPQHAYGYRPEEPLVFDGWVSGHAVYAPLREERGTDARALGLRATREVVNRFARLFPAAADRIQVRVHGDTDGRWAWGLFGTSAETASLRANLDLVTPLPSRTLTAFETGALSSGDGLLAYEPGPEGASPQRRFRRVRTDAPSAEMHLSLLLADRVAAFSARLGEASPSEATTNAWDTRLFFHEPRPETVDYQVILSERPDQLSLAVSQAVARTCGHKAPRLEMFSFDPEAVGPILRDEQRRGRWLVLVSRYPAYRAVQACENVTTLLDFASRLEGGRPVHVAVSLGQERQEECAASLERAVRTLLGNLPCSGRSLLARARSIAPGLALQALCSSQVALEGLLGLLLTQSQVNVPGTLVLSLDQHQHLLGGTGILADLLVLAERDGGFQLAVSEAKFTTLQVTTSSEPVSKAQRQVRVTRDRLDRFVARHPLAAMPRAALVRAAVQQVHLLDRTLDVERRRTLAKMLARLADPEVPVTISPEDQTAIHVWSWHEGTLAGIHSLNGIPTHIHSRTETTQALQSLAT
ncbi:hypothetical protein [Myxococcus sp. AB025B]|uniref:hypothetical protein n=1 Tax=Myxococcus sp. AB025B TaxID=2562794 RepID=UPI0011418795|nr:hypothetical protein [Myxococcus sp. AB025B]